VGKSVPRATLCLVLNYQPAVLACHENLFNYEDLCTSRPSLRMANSLIGELWSPHSELIPVIQYPTIAFAFLISSLVQPFLSSPSQYLLLLLLLSLSLAVHVYLLLLLASYDCILTPPSSRSPTSESDVSSPGGSLSSGGGGDYYASGPLPSPEANSAISGLSSDSISTLTAESLSSPAPSTTTQHSTGPHHPHHHHHHHHQDQDHLLDLPQSHHPHPTYTHTLPVLTGQGGATPTSPLTSPASPGLAAHSPHTGISPSGLSVQMFHKTRGGKGAWLLIGPMQLIRVTKGIGKRLRMVVRSPEPFRAQPDLTVELYEVMDDSSCVSREFSLESCQLKNGEVLLDGPELSGGPEDFGLDQSDPTDSDVQMSEASASTDPVPSSGMADGEGGSSSYTTAIFEFKIYQLCSRFQFRVAVHSTAGSASLFTGKSVQFSTHDSGKLRKKTNALEVRKTKQRQETIKTRQGWAIQYNNTII